MKKFKSLLFAITFGGFLFTSAIGASAMGPCGPISANPGGVSESEILATVFETRLVEALNDIGSSAGFAIGIVRGDEVLYAKGFGYSDLESCRPVNPDTGFYLLSTTKSFTGMAAGLLHEEGHLELDKSLRNYFPDLEMPDNINPAQISVRSLLTHGKTFANSTINYRTFAPGNLHGEALLEVLETYSTPKSPEFRYSNTGYVVAGHVMQTVMGQSWREILEQKIFEPLGMTNSHAYIEDALAGDYAYPYYRDPDGHMAAGFLKTENQMHAAGGSTSSVNDLNRWLIANLNEGRIGGRQVLPARVVRQAHAPQIQYDLEYYKFKRFGYGFGVHNADYEGELLIHHFGGAIHVSFMPERGLGVVVLSSNAGQGALLAHAVAALAYDTLLGKENIRERWETEMAAVKEGMERNLDRYREYHEVRLPAMADPGDPVFKAEQLVGSYMNDRLGEFVLSGEDGNLTITFGEIVVPFERLDGNTFTAFLVPLDLIPAQVVDIRRDEELGLVLDWGERIFVRQ